MVEVPATLCLSKIFVFHSLISLHFRLVIDRETGKPKGYGFCEYKDEETALSARRNLQGYEINGRQLRVDFAENDRGSDRNREQVNYPWNLYSSLYLLFFGKNHGFVSVVGSFVALPLFLM